MTMKLDMELLININWFHQFMVKVENVLKI